MKKLCVWFVWIAVMLVGCGSDEASFNMCECEPDQYCVDDKCYDTDGTIVPAPGMTPD